ncbi:MAG TPA: cytochrome c [Candidatus Angelobacter sp.]|nr:cytochrome c [Candidatus Angelobacter sp.]
MGRFIFGVIIGLLIPAAIGYCYFRYGYAPVATSSAPMPFEKTMARMALKARISKEAPKNAPIQPTEDNLTSGAKTYMDNCAFCHGFLNQTATKAAKGMFPLPPQLLTKDEMVTDDPVGVTYWKVKNGIRMTGMPGFGEMLSDNEIWQVSEMLGHADKLPPSALVALQQLPATPATQQGQAQPQSTNPEGRLTRKK